VGKYGTNLEGFGAFEGGVNADKGAPLVSTSSDGETALLFGPAALREIQAGVANGDFAIPPDEAGSTITDENPLPYWTFTDVNSAGAITCAIVPEATAASGNVLRWTVNSGTLTGKSATLTRYVPVPSSASRSFSFYAEATFENGTDSPQANAKVTCQFYKQDQTTTTGTAFNSPTFLFSELITPEGLMAPDIYGYDPDPPQNSVAPSDAAFVKITITIATVATQSAARTVDLTEVRLGNGLPEIIFPDKNVPTNPPGYIIHANSDMIVAAGNDAGLLSLGASTVLYADLDLYLDSPQVVVTGTLDVDSDITATQFNSSRDAADNDVFLSSVSGDSVNRFLIEADGGMFWGSGSSARDVNLYRASANVLRTDDGLEVGNGSIGSNGTFSGLNANLTGGNGLRHDTPATTTATSNAGIWVLVSGTNYQLRRNSSSARYKTNIVDADEVVLDAARKVKPRHYESTIEDEAGATRLGFIAEEIHEAGLTHAVGYDNEGKPETIDPVALIAALWHRVSDLEDRLKALEEA
jgi:hypothetical protein